MQGLLSELSFLIGNVRFGLDRLLRDDEGVKFGCLKLPDTCVVFFFFFWLRWVFVAARRLSLAAASGGYSSLWCACFSLWWLLLLRSTGSRRAGFSSCGTRAQ